MIDIITQVLRLQATAGNWKRILLQKMDIKRAFRSMGVALDRTAAFPYQLEDLVLVQLRLQFAWHVSPGW